MSNQDPDLDERSVGELVQRVSRQAAELVRQELRLAQTELAEKGNASASAPGWSAPVASWGCTAWRR